MSLYDDDPLGLTGRSNQHINLSLPVNRQNEHVSLSDRKETSTDEDSTSIDEPVNLESNARLSPSPNESSTSFLEDAPKCDDSSTLPKPVGRLQRWKYCLLGQSKLNAKEKNVHENLPINTADGDSCRVCKSVETGTDKDIDLSEIEDSNPKVSSQSCSVICSSSKDEVSNSISRFTTTDLDVTADHNTNTSLKNTISPHGSGNSDPDMDYDCRICHTGSSTGKLVSPCYCTGTMGQMHAACLEKWLSSNGRKDCELCGYHYHLYREPRSFKEFLKYPGTPNLSRHLKCDLICFAVLSPTTLLSVSLLLYATNLLEWKLSWSVVGLLSTAVFLAIIYMFWSVMAFTYQRKVWQKWRLTNQIVRLKSTSKDYWDYQDSQLPSTASEASMIEAHMYLPASTVAFTSRGGESNHYAQSPEFLCCDDPKPSVSTYISFDPYHLSQSYSYIRAALPSSSSSTCTFTSEPSLVMESDFHDAISAKQLPGKS